MNISNRVNQLKKSAIHEMTRLSKQYDDVAFLSWAKPTSDTPEHIKNGALMAITVNFADMGAQAADIAKNILKNQSGMFSNWRWKSHRIAQRYHRIHTSRYGRNLPTVLSGLLSSLKRLRGENRKEVRFP